MSKLKSSLNSKLTFHFIFKININISSSDLFLFQMSNI